MVTSRKQVIGHSSLVCRGTTDDFKLKKILLIKEIKKLELESYISVFHEQQQT